MDANEHIKCACPNCQKKFSLESRYAGKKARCPQCKSVFTIPTTSDPQVNPVSVTTQPGTAIDPPADALETTPESYASADVVTASSQEPAAVADGNNTPSSDTTVDKRKRTILIVSFSCAGFVALGLIVMAIVLAATRGSDEIPATSEHGSDETPNATEKVEISTCCADMNSLEAEVQVILGGYQYIWQYTIHGEPPFDFNYFLNNLVKGMEPQVKDAREKYDGLQNRIKTLGKQSDKLGKAYDELLNAFAALGEMMELAEKPTGTLKTFTEKIQNLHSTFTQAMTKVETLSP
jgi:hypothetical protein